MAVLARQPHLEEAGGVVLLQHLQAVLHQARGLAQLQRAVVDLVPDHLQQRPPKSQQDSAEVPGEAAWPGQPPAHSSTLLLACWGIEGPLPSTDSAMEQYGERARPELRLLLVASSGLAPTGRQAGVAPGMAVSPDTSCSVRKCP